MKEEEIQMMVEEIIIKFGPYENVPLLYFIAFLA